VKVSYNLSLQDNQKSKIAMWEKRPWGIYEVLLATEKYLIKRIVVKPQAQLSLQSHQHRDEHWVMVVGNGQVQKGEEKFVLHSNESIYIPAGTRHRIANNDIQDIVFIEIQMGEQLREDDIIRYEDIYGRY
jgi:mannose-1-phosphate guanylyltransferase